MMKSFSDKRILIAGAGAIGSFYGGLMSLAGYNVELLTRGKHLLAMQKERKLYINSWKHGQQEISVNPVAEATGVYDIIFICVKSQDTAETCAALQKHLAEDGCAVSFQNGVENPDVLVSFFGGGKTLGASLFIGAWIDSPGNVLHMAQGEITFGPFGAGSESHVPMLQEIFTNSGITASVTDDMKHSMWFKLVWNVAYNPLSALLLSTCGPMINSPVLYPLIENMVLEVVAAAKMHGVTITEEQWKSKIAHRDSLERYKTSMLIDIEKGRSVEVDGILGPVVRTHEKHGQKAPYCESILRTVQFKYGGHYIYCPRLTVDMIVRRGDEILLVERKYEPHGWALPGGFVDYGETVEHAAVRELQEETGITAEGITMLGVYSDPDRDKRGHTVSVVYSTTTDAQPEAGDDAKNAVFYKINDLPADICFDHKKIISDYLNKN